MGIFDFLKSSSSRSSKSKASIDFKKDSRDNRTLFDILNEINEYKYVNDYKAQQLYEKAYKQTEGNVIDQHFFFNDIIDYYYGLRNKQENALEKCIEYCIEDIKITPTVLDEMKCDDMWKQYNQDEQLIFIPPRFPSFQRLVIIYEKQQEYTKAIDVCEKALQLNLRDGTKTGFKGRIKRLKKKMS